MSTALVRSATNAGLAMYLHGMAKRRRRYAPAFQRARAAISHVIRNRSMYNKAGIRFKRSYAKWRRSRRKFKPNQSTTRTSENVVGWTPSPNGMFAMSEKTLSWGQIEDPGNGTEQGQLNSEYIYIRGLQTCWKFRNDLDGAVTNRVTGMLHFGILQPLCHERITNDADFKEGFFRDFREAGAPKNTGRLDFVDGAGYDGRYECYPINTNKWKVLMHRKIRTSSLQTGNQQQNNCVDFKRYIKINRRYKQTYDGSKMDLTQPFYWFAFWQLGEPNNSPAAGAFNGQVFVKLVFNDGK